MEEAPNSFIEWAREGERFCKVQKFTEGIEAFLNALKGVADEVETLSSVYCQLGNAYAAQKQYDKALEYHLYDVTLTNMYKDRSGEARACGNVANVYKMQASFNYAMEYTKRQIDLAREAGDKSTESLGLYNLASVHHLKGRQTANMLKSAADLNHDYSQESVDSLSQAIGCYKNSLVIAEELNDRQSTGRIYGSLGNAYFLLQDYENAINFHELRLEVGKEFDDKSAMKRAYSNLGKVYALISRKDKAIEYYQLALDISKEHEFSWNDSVCDSEISVRPQAKRAGPISQEEFFDYLSRLQSNRMDEQRCDAPVLTNSINKQRRQADSISFRSDDSFTISTIGKKKHRRSILGRISSSIFKDPNQLLSSTPFSRKIKFDATSTKSNSLNDTPTDERAPTIVEDDIGELVTKMQAGGIEEKCAHLQVEDDEKK